MRRAIRHRIGIALAAALAFHALVWICLPSQEVHADALDELRVLEAGTLPATGKHPADGPVLTALFRGLRALGYEGRAIRPIQLWNGAWMTAALAGLACLARRRDAYRLGAAGVAVILAGTHASLHQTIDPFLSYYPPGLALLTWGLALSAAPAGARADGRLRREACASVACLTAGALFNPMCAIGAPLAALSWFHRTRAAGRSTAGASLRGLAVVGVPLGILLVIRSRLPMDDDLPYGAWTERTWMNARNAARAALLFHGRGFDPMRLGHHDLAAVVLSAAYRGFAVATLAGAALLACSRSGAARFLPWGLAAAVCGAFVAWWDPGQIQFWLLPAWVLGLGAIHAMPSQASVEAGVRGRIARIAALVLLGEGALLWAANGALYVLPVATGESATEQRIARIAERLAPEDLLVFLDWGDPALGYYADVRFDSLLSLHMRRAEGQSTFAHLRKRFRDTKRRGGAVYLQVPAPGLGWITPLARALSRRDFEEEHFAHLELGERIELEGLAFQRLLGFTREPPAPPAGTVLDATAPRGPGK